MGKIDWPRVALASAFLLSIGVYLALIYAAVTWRWFGYVLLVAGVIYVVGFAWMLAGAWRRRRRP